MDRDVFRQAWECCLLHIVLLYPSIWLRNCNKPQHYTGRCILPTTLCARPVAHRSVKYLKQSLFRLRTCQKQLEYTTNTKHCDNIGYDCDVNKVNNRSTCITLTVTRINHPNGGHYRTVAFRVEGKNCQNIKLLSKALPIFVYS